MVHQVEAKNKTTGQTMLVAVACEEVDRILKAYESSSAAKDAEIAQLHSEVERLTYDLKAESLAFNSANNLLAQFEAENGALRERFDQIHNIIHTSNASIEKKAEMIAFLKWVREHSNIGKDDCEIEQLAERYTEETK